MQRRKLLSLAGLIALPTQLLASERELTPSQQEGPFYPVVPIPLRPSLIVDPDNLVGDSLVLDGQVINQQGKPQTDVKVEIWQCDGTGIYDHPAQNGTDNFDKSFAGFGAQLTNDEGRYGFTTLFPVPYTGRPPHIHAKLWRNDETLLTTQLYLKGETGKGWFGSRREHLQIAPVKDGQGQLRADFVFVV